MNRVFKQFLYGLGFLAALLSLLIIFYFLFFRQPLINLTPSQIATQNISPLQKGEIKYFIASGKVISVAQIKNSNPDYGSDNFSYTLDIYGKNGEKIKNLNGYSFIYNADAKYVLEITDADQSNIGFIDIDFGQTNWKSKNDFQKPKLTIANQTTQNIPNGKGTETIGTITNESEFGLSKVFIVGFLENSTGLKISASKTELENLKPFESRPFQIVFPPDIKLLTDSSSTPSFFSNISLADPNKTEIYADGK